jgi:hypothetical protein
MPQILFTWLITLLAAVSWGGLVQKSIQFFFPEKRKTSLWLQFWTGLVMISMMLSVFTFFLPLTAKAKLLLWMMVLICPSLLNRKAILSSLSLIEKKLFSLHPLSWILFILTAAIGLMKASGLPEIFDEGAYHLPLIRMWEQQGLVIGMANLNGHYGLHSVWHLLSAFTSLDFIPGFQSEMCLNGMLAALLGLFAASRLQHFLSRREFPGAASFIAVLLPVFLFRNLLSSPSTDVPAIIACWFFFLIWLEVLERRESAGENPELFLLLPLWMVSVKSSTAGILAVPAFFILQQVLKANRKSFLFSASAALIMLGIWVLQNWLLSGYAVFPLPFTALGNPEWQVPAECIQKKFYLEQFGDFAPPDFYSMSWLKKWFLAHNADSRLIILLAAFFFFLAPFSILRRKEIFSASAGFFLLLLLMAGIWFFTITEPRYGFGALVIAALLLPAFLFQKLAGFREIFRYSLLLILPLMAFSAFKTYREFSSQNASFLVPATVPKVEFRKLACGNFEASSPVSYISPVPEEKPVFCWDCPFPCIPLEGIADSSHVFWRNESQIPYFYFKKNSTINPY